MRLAFLFNAAAVTLVGLVLFGLSTSSAAAAAEADAVLMKLVWQRNVYDLSRVSLQNAIRVGYDREKVFYDVEIAYPKDSAMPQSLVFKKYALDSAAVADTKRLVIYYTARGKPKSYEIHNQDDTSVLVTVDYSRLWGAGKMHIKSRPSGIEGTLKGAKSWDARLVTFSVEFVDLPLFVRKSRNVRHSA
ncbi:hypothetical protein THASP1DRAFT_24858 [Thamnocephalis sphaerospora]|uniref:Uncharacterized protein n=1 Tax=Thamnocephalis sphaerospora TaxID=78915 RepID=A0A4P9XNS8_9FUNG|nr:hypothetical protein THASP1DRAFT_24858 [Thamnocephalis sphaerospora]|eukprot:RKP06900.1 hypothetical protein THASP1DRAFT_24858 [Thamnocephalis sphaerospora]